MLRENILTQLERSACAISLEDVLVGGLYHLLEQGLQVLTICNLGDNRSEVVARVLTHDKKTPAARLRGGLSGIYRHLNSQDGNLQEIETHLYAALNACPHLALIINRTESLCYRGIIKNLNAARYDNQHSAIAKLGQEQRSFV